MSTNKYLSQNSVGALTPATLFWQPYLEAKQNASYLFSSIREIDHKIGERSRVRFKEELTFGRLVLHFIATILLAIPLINIITLLFLRQFTKQKYLPKIKRIKKPPLKMANPKPYDLPLEGVLSNTQVSFKREMAIATRLLGQRCRALIQQKNSAAGNGALLAMLFMDVQLSTYVTPHPSALKLEGKALKKEGKRQTDTLDKILPEESQKLVTISELHKDEGVTTEADLKARLRQLKLTPIVNQLSSEERGSDLLHKLTHGGPAIATLTEGPDLFRRVIIEGKGGTTGGPLILRDPELGQAVWVKWEHLEKVLQGSIIQVAELSSKSDNLTELTAPLEISSIG